jgi:hypothetical protein
MTAMTINGMKIGVNRAQIVVQSSSGESRQLRREPRGDINKGDPRNHAMGRGFEVTLFVVSWPEKYC